MGFTEKIDELNRNNVYPFHMPGHKRRVEYEGNPYHADITEIDGYDNLHKPAGMIKELEDRISNLYGARKSYVLINGSTGGILAALSAAAGYGGRILMARNSHKSAYNAVCLRGFWADYVYPEYIGEPGINASVTGEAVEEALRRSREEGRFYGVVYITSPTYEGVVSDIRRLARLAHQYGAALIVDEAHGAHFGLSSAAPESAVKLGADAVVQSIHKTLMGMTQTALLHLGEGDGTSRIDQDRLEYFLSVYQSSSPSYILMASVDRCIGMIEKDRQGGELFEKYYGRLETFYEDCRKFEDIRIFTPKELDRVDKNRIFDFDCGKLLFYSAGGALSGREIYSILREKYGLQPEMSMGRYCLAMTSCMDCDEGFMRLKEALWEIDRDIAKEKAKRTQPEAEGGRNNAYCHVPGQQRAVCDCTIAQALEADKRLMELQEGLTAGDYGYVYPPGIPFIVPGEIVTKEIICDIMKSREAGYEVHGITASGGGLYIKALKR